MNRGTQQPHGPRFQVVVYPSDSTAAGVADVAWNTGMNAARSVCSLNLGHGSRFGPGWRLLAWNSLRRFVRDRHEETGTKADCRLDAD